MRRIDELNFETTHFTLFSGMGGLSLGLDRGCARIGNVANRMRCVGGVDVWPAAVKDFTAVTGVQGTVLDLFSREDYEDFHGRPPPAGWREATAADLRRAAGGEFPDIIATSPPCKGFSGLLNKELAKSRRYQALNNLTVRGLALALEAFADDPPSLVLLENVPRIQTGGRPLIDTMKALLRSHGYAVEESTHDCGELGGLAQRRRRFLMVARHTAKVGPYLYEPPKKRVRGIGEVLSELPLPEAEHAGPMHRMPRLTWMTWVRLALIEAGKDWRYLRSLAVEDGVLRDLGIAPITNWRGGVLDVRRWTDPARVVGGRSYPTCDSGQSVADPRLPLKEDNRYQSLGVVRWTDPSRTVTSQAAPGAGPYSVPDPRLSCDDGPQGRYSNAYKIVRWGDPFQSVTSARGALAAVQDPRGLSLGEYAGKMAVQDWEAPARTITGTVDVQSGAQVIADPRAMRAKSAGGDWSTSGFYGVRDWNEPLGAVTAGAAHDTGRFSVADPRLPGLEDRPDPVPLIVSLDNTWHRPLTTLELAALQGYPVFGADGRPLAMDGGSDEAWRERIGNSVPVQAAHAIGDEMARTMLLEALGEKWILSDTPIWVQPIALAVTMSRMQTALEAYNDAVMFGPESSEVLE